MKSLAAGMVACCVLLAVVGRAEVKAAGQNSPARQATFGEETGTLSREPIADAVTKQLAPLLNELQAAANAHDTDRFMAFYIKGDGLTAIFNGEAIRGWDNLYAQQLKWWNHGKIDAVYTMQGYREFMVLGPDAAVVTMFESSTRTGADGKPSENRFAISMVWQKLMQNGWKIVYSHESTVH
ncbi:MAG TPA: nuclear transport factor 2 family protein [Candidatus Acidoferrales bacterium]